MLKEILNVLKVHGEKVDRRFEQIDHRLERIEEQLNHHGKKSNGLRADFHETQGDVNYLLKKNAQHEEKLHQLSK